jgi:hypothetical protein
MAEITGGAHLFASLVNASPPPATLDASKHLVLRQFAFERNENDKAVQPEPIYQTDGTLLYRIWPNMVVRGRFEKLGGGDGYIWGAGAGYFEYVVPARKEYRRVGKIVVRAHIQPIWPDDVEPSRIQTRVTLFLNGSNFGWRQAGIEDPKTPLILEWQIDSVSARLRVARGQPFTVRFSVLPDSDFIYGINISNWPEGYQSKNAAPVEVEIK